jgi:hypothetical protein
MERKTHPSGFRRPQWQEPASSRLQNDIGNLRAEP